MAEKPSSGSKARFEHRSVLGLSAAGIALFVSGLLLAVLLNDGCARLHPAVQLSATSARLQRAAGCGTFPPLADFRWSLLADSLLIVVGYWLFSTMALVATWWRHEPPALTRWTPAVMLLPTLAALLDLVENALSAVFVASGDAGYRYDPEWAGMLIAAVAWSKWTVLVALWVVVLVVLVSARAALRADPARARLRPRCIGRGRIGPCRSTSTSTSMSKNWTRRQPPMPSKPPSGTS